MLHLFGGVKLEPPAAEAAALVLLGPALLYLLLELCQHFPEILRYLQSTRRGSLNEGHGHHARRLRYCQLRTYMAVALLERLHEIGREVLLFRGHECVGSTLFA